MNKYIDNIKPSTFTLSAISIGYILISKLNVSEQNAIGNWFMLIGQVLCTNSSQISVYKNNTVNISSLKNSINIVDEELNKL